MPLLQMLIQMYLSPIVAKQNIFFLIPDVDEDKYIPPS